MRVWIVQLTYAPTGASRVEAVFETEEVAKAYIKAAERRSNSDGYNIVTGKQIGRAHV